MPGLVEEPTTPADGVIEHTGAMRCAFRTPLYRPNRALAALPLRLGYNKVCARTDARQVSNSDGEKKSPRDLVAGGLKTRWDGPS